MLLAGNDTGESRDSEVELPGAFSDAVHAQVTKAIFDHGKEAKDEARVIIQPLERDESLWMVEQYDHVAAYIVMTYSEFLCGSEPALHEKLAARLSVLPVDIVDVDIVWGKKGTVALYVKAKLAT